MDLQTNLKMFSIRHIRDEVKSGKTKKQVANEIGISYHKVRKYTGDIYRSLRIPYKLEKQIREEVKNGKTKKQVAKEFGLCTKTVSRYTRNIKTSNPISKQQVETIREEVKKYKSKVKVAKMLNISYRTVLYYTRDIIIRKKPSKEMIEQIREEVKGGKSRLQVSKDIKLSYHVVCNYSIDLPSTKTVYKRHTGIKGRALEILNILMSDGYHICIPRDVAKYRLLKKRIPTIYKVHLYNKTIVFLEEKSNEAIRGFLEHINKRKISCHELEKISKVFNSKLSRSDKKKYSSNF
jgi:DNA-binding CsgD family transcriptional regulator